MFQWETVFGVISGNYLFRSSAFRKYKSTVRNILKGILVQGFCSLKTEISRFPLGFRPKVYLRRTYPDLVWSPPPKKENVLDPNSAKLGTLLLWHCVAESTILQPLDREYSEVSCEKIEPVLLPKCENFISCSGVREAKSEPCIQRVLVLSLKEVVAWWATIWINLSKCFLNCSFSFLSDMLKITKVLTKRKRVCKTWCTFLVNITTKD